MVVKAVTIEGATPDTAAGTVAIAVDSGCAGVVMFVVQGSVIEVDVTWTTWLVGAEVVGTAAGT